MPLIPAEVETAYRLILERMPSPEETANAASSHDKLGALRQTLLNSEEFYRKFDAIRGDFAKRLKPIVVHLHIPEAVHPALFDALTSAETLQPPTLADVAEFTALCAKPRPERLKLRYLYGDLGAGCGANLRLPYMHLCTIARPGPRLFRIYRAACDTQDTSKMSFGTYLEYSLDSVPHRLELDNGQVRRLSGQQDTDSLGKESELLPRALHNALAPDMILGLFEHPDAVAAHLAEADILPAIRTVVSDDITADTLPDNDFDKQYTAALNGLSEDERVIFETYTAWDNYFYDVCEALLFPTTE